MKLLIPAHGLQVYLNIYIVDTHMSIYGDMFSSINKFILSLVGSNFFDGQSDAHFEFGDAGDSGDAGDGGVGGDAGKPR